MALGDANFVSVQVSTAIFVAGGAQCFNDTQLAAVYRCWQLQQQKPFVCMCPSKISTQGPYRATQSSRRPAALRIYFVM
jgi:hypothetical protein